MRGLLRSIPSRSISCALSLALALGPALSYVRPAYATEAEQGAPGTASSPAVAASSAEATADPTPTVVRELVDLRTETSTSYLLSDGDIKAVISQAPVRFKDETGGWVDIDPTLVPADGQGTVESAATSMTAAIGAQAPGVAPVTLSGEGYSVWMDYLGAVENAKVVIGDTATYLDVAPATTLSYQSRDNGIKETFTLSDASAPTTYRFAVRLGGLSIGKTPEGTYALYSPAESTPKLELGGLCVFDSSENAIGDPVYCDETTMTVTDAGNGTAYVTYEISEGWLSDAARVFPVRVDPTLSRDLDTYVSSAYPSTSYNSSDELKCGYYDSGTGHNRSYVRFDTSSIPAGSYIRDTSFTIQQFHQYYTNTGLAPFAVPLSELGPPVSIPS